jgi:hypothetical protein
VSEPGVGKASKCDSDRFKNKKKDEVDQSPQLRHLFPHTRFRSGDLGDDAFRTERYSLALVPFYLSRRRTT